MSLRPCLELGCPNLVRSGRCPVHRRARRQTAEWHRWVYRDPRWARARAAAIERAGGRCQAVDSGRRCEVVSGLHGHHDHLGGLRQLLLDGGDPFDARRVVALCEVHHARLEAGLRAFRR